MNYSIWFSKSVQFVKMNNNKLFKAGINALLIISLHVLGTGWVVAERTPEPAILVVGASWANGNLPLNDDLVGVWGGLNVGLGSFLDLGLALVRDKRLAGYVINEAVAGASSVGHHDCSINGGTSCSSAYWISIGEQFERALRRVANPAEPGTYNADFVVITSGNDCMHSNNYDVPEVETSPCTIDDINVYIDNMITVGQRALDVGITPIFFAYPDSSQLDFSLSSGGFYWFIDNETWDFMADLYRTRITSELPDAAFLDIFENFEHRGDGIHQTDKTSKKAASIIAKFIVRMRKENY